MDSTRPAGRPPSGAGDSGGAVGPDVTTPYANTRVLSDGPAVHTTAAHVGLVETKLMMATDSPSLWMPATQVAVEGAEVIRHVHLRTHADRRVERHTDRSGGHRQLPTTATPYTGQQLTHHQPSHMITLDTRPRCTRDHTNYIHAAPRPILCPKSLYLYLYIITLHTRPHFAKDDST